MDCVELEREAAALARGLSSRLNWAEIEVFARNLALEHLTPAGEELGAAARALDALAQSGTQGGHAAREAGLWAAGAFAAGGNFPSASVVVRRSFPRLSERDTPTATLLSALAPTLRDSLRAKAPLVGVLDEFLGGADVETEAALREQLWREWERVEGQEWSGDIWRLGRRALERVLEAATARRLDAAQFPPGFAARVANRVPTLLPSQLQALDAGFLSGGNALVTLPPGTGKTLLGELFLAAALGRRAGLAVFLVPYVALGRGVLAALREHLPPDVKLYRWLGGQGGDEKIDWNQSAIAVATPERFDALWRSRPELREHLRGVVVDEAHTLGDGLRGARLEGLIARLMAGENAPPLALLSAALDSSQELADWIGARVIVDSNWTPTARRLAFWRQDGVLEWHGELADGKTQPLGEVRLPWPQPHLAAGDDFMAVRRQEPLAWHNVAHLARHLHEERGGAILCLCSTRRATRDLARALSQAFPEATEPTGARARAIEAIETRHRTLRPLAALLRQGVTWHNSSLPIELRALIETAISEGSIGAVAATSTLAEGVDLPFAQTILAEWMKWDGGGQKPISAALFRNIAGRCGRAGAYTEGDTFVFDNPLGPREFTAPAARRAVQHELYLGAQLHEPSSTFARSEQFGVGAALEAQLLGLRAAYPAAPRARFFAAFYAARDPKFVPLVETAWARLEAEGLLDANDALSARGALFARLDWSPQTTKKLLGALEVLPTGDYESIQGAAKLNAYLWRALGAAPEAGPEVARLFASRSRFVATQSDLEVIGRAWLEARPPEEIFARLPRAQKLEGLAVWLEHEERDGESGELPAWSGDYDRWLDFVRAGLETWTPWLWRAAGLLAPSGSAASQIVKWWQWAARWELGVDSDWAVRALRSQVPGGRSAVAAVGRLWPFQSSEPHLDPLVLAPLGTERGAAAVGNAFEAALKSLGGAHSHAGRNVLVLRDWLHGRVGLTK